MGHFRKYDQPCNYDIRVEGNISPIWADWFDGFAIQSLAEGETSLKGVIIDQAGLFGILALIRTLRLTLISLQRVQHA